MGKQLGDQSEVTASYCFCTELDDGLVYDTSSLDPEAARRRMEETLRSNAARPLYTGTAVSMSAPSWNA